MTRMSKNQNIWENEIAPESNTSGCSDWKPVSLLINKGLPWTKNGNQRHNKFLGLTKYIWDCKMEKNRVVAIRTIGYDPDIKAANLLKNRPISKNIRKHFKGKSCVACGGNKRMVVDHKNDLYNDDGVHSVKTQKISDFQPLCNNCNLKKRAACRKTKETGLRQPAPYMCIKMGGPKFIEGDETFDPDGLGMQGTFWYDCEAYFTNSTILS